MKSIPMFLSADWIIDDDDQNIQESELLIKSGVMNEVILMFLSADWIIDDDDQRCKSQSC